MTTAAMMKKAGPWLGALFSGFLLAGSFAPRELAEAAWIALVPVLVAAWGVDLRRAFQLGLVAGLAFWLPSIWWLTRVTPPGWFGMALYCSLYVALFVVGAALWYRRWGVAVWWRNLLFMLAVSAWWAGLELARSTWFTGFPWNPLGATQYRNAALLQPAAWGGVSAVSALVVWVNAGLAVTVLQYIERRGQWGRRPHPEIIAAFLVVAVTFAWGVKRLRATSPGEPPIRLALIQTNIPQEEKWDEATIATIYQRLRDLTLGALRAGTSDLIIWPETALPDDVATSVPSYNLVYELVTNGTPILVGSMDTHWPESGRPTFYNSSFLFDANGEPIFVYDKQHLVPFGEYIPLPHLLPFLKALTPIQESFSPGTTSTLFRLPGRDVPFSTLICFEDTVPHLARAAVRNGARLLINQTNDAWFDPYAASRQHMIQSILRAVENGVPLVRVANTGVSCVIDRRGVVSARLENEQGGTRFAGFKLTEVRPAPPGMPLTFYTRQGDLLPAAAGLAALALFLALAGLERRAG
jgi:apolipoprotein N-acyltransferase